MNQIVTKAPAKINLTLDIIGKLDNGYHDLRMIMQTIDLCDELSFQTTTEAGIRLTMNQPLPDGCPMEQNLVYRAADLIQQKYQISGGLNIYLDKKIPAAAGLAGGSTDCAATLTALNNLYELHLSQQELCEIGVTLGADVPFCICQGIMLSEGIGEILTPLPSLPPLWVLLIKPDISVSTGYVYGHFDMADVTNHPETERIIDAIHHRDAATVAHHLSNVLETVTIPAYPVIQEIKEFLLQEDAVGALMSGSGPSTYGLYQDEIRARMAYRQAQTRYPDYDVILCQTKKPDQP
ncbi:MAG: 4-(cytidine 5'-diphospho)-2-C-methyl-D-erythritol kinase [Lachnospiraceae bacterium]|nr:4-(cytidine 5'-diphospho)-2-C-methyl-D-erythritol kinase [Lachnospiraceae bacterium]